VRLDVRQDHVELLVQAQLAQRRLAKIQRENATIGELAQS
jgi:hypothetical protein